MKTATVCLVSMGILLLVAPPPASAIELREYVFTAGGDRLSGASCRTTCTLGQILTEGMCNSDWATYTGFWHPYGWRSLCYPSSGIGLPAHPPVAFELIPVSPNPVGRQGAIRFGLPRAAPVSIGIYDVAGRLRARPIDGVIPAGWHQTMLDRAGLCSGIYFCRMSAPGFQAVRRFVLTK